MQVDSVAAHGNAFRAQELALWLALRDRVVGTDDAMPGESVGGCEDAADECPVGAISLVED